MARNGVAREELARKARAAYESPMTLVQVAEQLGCSYGKVHALIKEAGGETRTRGSRSVPKKERVTSTPRAEAALRED